MSTGADMPEDRAAKLLRELNISGDGSLGGLSLRHRQRLRRLVELRLDPRLRGRLDPSDVVQEAFVEASERFEAYQRDPAMPAFLWLRFLTVQRLALFHRKDLGVQGRDAG